MDVHPDLRELIDRQDGLLTREQALSHGLTDSAVRHALRREGPWQRVVDGVYASFTGPVQERHHARAALLHCGSAAMITGDYACRAYGMRYAPRRGGLEVLVPWQLQRSRISIARIRRVRTMSTSRTLDHIPYAVPDRAALDAARHADSLREARAVLCEVVQRGLTTVDRLVAEAQNVDQRKFSHARHALRDVGAGCRSAPECELRDLVLSSDVLPIARWNQPLPDPEGSDLHPDGCFEEARVVLEVDSLEWHGYGEAPELTERRRARYASLGWLVIPISPRRLREDPAGVLAEIEAAVTRRGRGAA